MATSYFSLTAGGSLLALRLRDRFGGKARLPACQSLGCGHCDPFENISQALPERFAAGDTLVCIMAAGVVFRLLAPYLRSKQEDPAVIVMDEEGRHVIPLLGGHAAGANSLAMEIAAFLGAEAAVTTASDVRGLLAPDQVAAGMGARVADAAALRQVTALLVDGEPVCIESQVDPGLEDYAWIPPSGDTDGFAARLLVTFEAYGSTGNDDAAGDAAAHIPTARLVPASVRAGVGCRRGTPAAEITAAMEAAAAESGIDPLAIGVIASVDAKADERGLAEAAQQLDAELVFFTAAQLAALGRPGSDFVCEQVGTPAVSEPAALLAAGDEAELIMAKRAFGPVTVSLAAGTQAAGAGSGVRLPAGRLTIVGTGAGTAGLLTREAGEAIRDADVVVGYRTYVEQLRRIFPGKEYISGSMGREVDRCREALELAAAGRRVALVSSGDPGVYGMAGLALELANGVPVSIAPGVTAAQLAAASLGAPLMNDYITLSLSDLLTPREEVLRRAQAAAASDMVICLYNPTSRKRRPLFEQVCSILEAQRPGDTVVGWVREAGGPAETAALTTLSELSGQEIDMRTIVIVGNSCTTVIGGRMVTTRGYH